MANVLFGASNRMSLLSIFDELFDDLYLSGMATELERVEVRRYPGDNLEFFELVFDSEIVYELTVRETFDGVGSRELLYVGEWKEDALYNVLRDYVVDEYEKELDNLN